MNPEPRTSLEQLRKSIQTFESLQMAADNREKMYRYNDALMQSLYSILEDQEADEQTKLKFLDDTLSQYAAAMKELFPQIITKPVQKADADQFDMIEEVEKFNPYHDERGRFSTADRYDQFTITTRDPNKQHWADAAAARERERDAKGLIPGPKIDPGTLPENLPKEPPKTEPRAANLPAPEATKTTSNLNAKVLSACEGVEAKSVKLKNEKLTLVSENGEVIHEKRGSRGSVSIDQATAEKMGESTTLTHNHPGEFGGTFSGADVNILTKYNLRAIRAVGKEGAYSLERTSQTMGLKASTFNREYGALSDKTNRSIRSAYNKMRSKVLSGDMSADDANRQLAEHRNKLCNEMHDWLSQNASKYGFNYVFTPSTGGVTKMFDIEKEEDEVLETTGEDMLDGEFISGDNWMIKDSDEKPASK